VDAPAPHVERHPLEALRRGEALIDHPVAAKVAWRPLHVGGSNFRTAALAAEGDGTWRVGPSLGWYAFSLVFAGMGAWVLAEHVHGRGLAWPVVAGAALFVVIGLGLMLGAARWRIEPVRGRLWRRARPFSPEREVRTVDVVALQLLPEWVVAQRSRYWSYELNLVLADGSRVGLMDHGSLDAMRDDAARLGALLGVPVWEAEGRPMGILERLFGGAGDDA
jgi:hypothetical protein